MQCERFAPPSLSPSKSIERTSRSRSAAPVALASSVKRRAIIHVGLFQIRVFVQRTYCQSENLGSRSYSWMYGGSSERFVQVSERIFISMDGALYFAYNLRQDADRYIRVPVSSGIIRDIST